MVNLILIVSAGFTVLYMLYGMLNIPVSYQIEKEYTGIVFEDDNPLTVKIKGALKKRLFSMDEFSGNIEFLDGHNVTEYSLSLNAGEQVTEIGNTGWYISSINRKALFGTVTDWWSGSGNSKTIAVVEMTSDWKQIIITLLEDGNKRFIAPANNLEEAKRVEEELNLKFRK